MILPLEFQLTIARDHRLLRDHGGALRSNWFAVDLGLGQFTRDGGGESRLAAFDHGKRAAPDILFRRFGETEISRQGDVGFQRAELRSQGWFQVNALCEIADADVQPYGVDLWRHLEGILAVGKRGGYDWLPARSHFGLCRTRYGLFGKPDGHHERLAVGHDQAIGQWLDHRESIPRRVAPGHQESCPGVRRGGRISREQTHANHDGAYGTSRPTHMSGVWNRVGEIT